MNIALAVSLLTLAGFGQVDLEPRDDAGDPERVLAQFLDAEFAFQQSAFGERLIEIGDRSVIPRLVEELENPDRMRRVEAAYVLDGLGDARGYPAFVRELQDTDVGDRLVKIRASDGRPNPHRQVTADRWYAAAVAGRWGRKVAPDLTEQLGDPTIAGAAAYSLGEIGDPVAIPALRSLIDSSDDFDDKTAAGLALALLDQDEGFDFLREYIDHGNSTERKRLLFGLRELEDPRAFDIFLGALADEDVHVRMEAVLGLKELGDPRAIPALRPLLNDHARATMHRTTTVAEEAERAIAALQESRD